MPKNRGHIASLARSYTDTAIKTLAGIMMEQTSPPMARIVAAKVLLDRGWGKPKEMHHSEVDDNKTLLKVVNEIVHVYETREQADRVQRPNPTVRDQPEQKLAAILTNGVLKNSAPRPSFSRCWRGALQGLWGAQRLAMYPRQCRA
jgi:hypothetical protein